MGNGLESELSVRICPLAVCRDSLDVVPVLNDLSVLKTEDVIEGNMLARSNSELALADLNSIIIRNT